MGAFTVTPNVDLMPRYQQFEDDKWGITNNEITSTDLGVKYYFARKERGGSNIALNYMLRDADSGVTQKIFDERGANVTGNNIDDVIMAPPAGAVLGTTKTPAVASGPASPPFFCPQELTARERPGRRSGCLGGIRNQR